MSRAPGAKLRVVFAANDFLVGGVQKLYADLFDVLDHDALEVHLLTLMQLPGREDMYRLVNPRVTVHRLNFRSFADISQWLALLRLLRRVKPDAVVSGLFFANAVLRTCKLLLGYRVFATEHNTYIHKTRAQIFVDRLQARWTERIIVVSETVASFTSAQEKIPLQKFTVIRNGINLASIAQRLSRGSAEQVKQELGFSGQDRLIINVGRLTSQKNQRLLLEGFSLFAPTHPEHKLLILGEGTLRPVLEEYIHGSGLRGRVLLLGAKQNIYDYYLAADFFVSTSTIEGFGIAHVEAMAFGLPILTTETAGPDEYVRDGVNGYFIRGQAADVAAGLEKMAEADLAQLGAAAAAAAASYSIESAAQEYLRLLQPTAM